MNVYDQAHQLAAAVRESEEFRQFDRAKKEMEANPQLDQALKDFMARQFEMQTEQMIGKEPNADAFQQLQQLSAVLMADPSATNYLQCQMRFSVMMSDVYKILSEVSDMGIDPGMFGGQRG